MTKTLCALLIAANALAASPALANVTYLGSGLGRGCFDVVNGLNLSGPSNSDLKTCTEAIESGTLVGSDLPATYVNRGILFMRLERYKDAISDYERALKLSPGLAEAKVNMGAALIGLRRYATAIKSIEEGLQLDPRSPHVAYYNLGMAHEYMGDYKTARDHYATAAQIAPQWSPVLRKLESFPLKDVTTGAGPEG